jgi:hypothetical protein
VTGKRTLEVGVAERLDCARPLLRVERKHASQQRERLRVRAVEVLREGDGLLLAHVREEALRLLVAHLADHLRGGPLVVG